MKRYIFSLILLIAGASASFQMSAEPQTTRKERNTLLKANEAFNDKDYDKAMELYNMVLAINPVNERANYNLAVTMVKRADEIGGAGGNETYQQGSGEDMPESVKQSRLLKQQADSIFRNVYNSDAEPQIRENAVYNSGNLYFSENKYAESIEQYKKALRINPDNNNARHNLRVAQLRLQQQQNQDQNQNEDNKDQDNKDQQDQQNEQDQQNQQEQPQQPQPQQPQPQPQSSAENILNAAQQNEDKVRQRLEKQVPVSPRYHNKPW